MENFDKEVKNHLKKSQLTFSIIGPSNSGKTTLAWKLTNFESQRNKTKKFKDLDHLNKLYGVTEINKGTVDKIKYERIKKMTILPKSLYFETLNKKFSFVDTPGSNYKNSVSSLYAKSACILMISCLSKERNIMAIREYIIAIYSAGIKNIIVMINKMELVNYSELFFNDVMNQILSNPKIKDSLLFIPCSVIEEDNIYKKSKNFNWYNGKCLIEILEEIKPITPLDNNKPTRFIITDVFKKGKDDFVAIGNLFSGKIARGDKIFVSNTKFIVAQIQRRTEEIRFANADDGAELALRINNPIGIIKNNSISIPPFRGQVILGYNSDKIYSFKAKIFTLTGKHFKQGCDLSIFQISSFFVGRVKKIIIYDKQGKNFVEDKENKYKPVLVRSNQFILVKFKPMTHILLEKYSDCRYMGSIIIKFGKYTVGLGKIESIKLEKIK